MEDKFANDILRLEQEVLALKTCPIKTSTQMMTKSITQDFSVDLDYASYIYQNMAFNKDVTIITITSSNGTNMITDCTLENSGDAENYKLQGRSVSIIPCVGGNICKYRVNVLSSNPTDIDTLKNGGSVVLNYTVALTSTSDFDISVSQEPYSPF